MLHKNKLNNSISFHSANKIQKILHISSIIVITLILIINIIIFYPNHVEGSIEFYISEYNNHYIVYSIKNNFDYLIPIQIIIKEVNINHDYKYFPKYVQISGNSVDHLNYHFSTRNISECIITFYPLGNNEEYTLNILI